MGIHHSALRARRRTDAAETRARSRIIKAKERIRRDTRMAEKLRAGSLPYTPAVMSWLSRKLDKPANKITPENVKDLVS